MVRYPGSGVQMPNNLGIILGWHLNLETETLLHWTVADPKKALRCSIAMGGINKYLVAAQIQMDRIWKGLDKVKEGLDKVKEGSEDFKDSLPQAFCDIHFYFICWDTILKMMEVLKRCSDYSSVGHVLKKHRKKMEEYREARDHYEHYDERLPGGKWDLPKPGDLGNIKGSNFTLGGDRWDIGPASLKRLEKIVAELDAAVRAEGIPKYQEKIARRKEEKATAKRK